MWHLHNSSLCSFTTLFFPHLPILHYLPFSLFLIHYFMCHFTHFHDQYSYTCTSYSSQLHLLFEAFPINPFESVTAYINTQWGRVLELPSVTHLACQNDSISRMLPHNNYNSTWQNAKGSYVQSPTAWPGYPQP